MARYTINRTRQTEPTDRATVENLAGGHGFAMDPKLAVRRWLLTGSTGNSFYQSAGRQTAGNLRTFHEVAKEDPQWTADEIVSASDRAINLHTPILALAQLSVHAPREFRRIFCRVVRTASHLYEFCDYVKAIRGFGTIIRAAVRDWFEKNAEDLEYQFLKYQQREGWSARDILRKFKIPHADGRQDALFDWIVGKGWSWSRLGEAELFRVLAWERLRSGEEQPEKLIREHRLTHEMVPANVKRTAGIWRALYDQMPVGATLRNLGNLTEKGVLGLADRDRLKVLDQRFSAEALKRARIHPVAIASALRIYAEGGSLGRSKLSWKPVRYVVNSLAQAYDAAFDAVEPTGKTVLHAVDCSGSMDVRRLEPTWLRPADIAAVMALASMRGEDFAEGVAFDTALHDFPFDAHSSLDEVLAYRGPGGDTDCTLPISYALKNPVWDAVVIWTDGMSWAGDAHVYQVWRNYLRKRQGARLVIVNLIPYSDNVSLADPADRSMFDVVGFTAETPKLLNMIIGHDV